MGNGDDLSSDVVVDSVDRVGVDETVPHPQTSPHCLFHLTYHLESCLDSILVYSLIGRRRLLDCVGMVTKNVVRVV
jgi:hypothetical protein